MKPFLIECGTAVALRGMNIDTDVIMPKQFLRGVDRTGLDLGLFHDLRFDRNGHPRPDFVLVRYPEARFLVVGPNFGCGSSREHAVWGMLQFGIRAVIGTSFAGIFADNASNNGLLLVTLAPDRVESLINSLEVAAVWISIDLDRQCIKLENGETIPFEIDADRKKSLMLGLDRVGQSLEFSDEIEGFERDYYKENPWLVEKILPCRLK